MRKLPLLSNQKESLTELIKKIPCLFDKNLKKHTKKETLQKTWENVASELHFIEDGMEYIRQFIHKQPI